MAMFCGACQSGLFSLLFLRVLTFSGWLMFGLMTLTVQALGGHRD